MKTYDDLLPFLNRIVYSFPSGILLWKAFESGVSQSHIIIHEVRAYDTQSIYNFLYSELRFNKLLTKYAIASFTLLAWQDVYQTILNTFYGVIQEGSILIRLKSMHDRVAFVLSRKVSIQSPQQSRQYDIKLQFDIYKSIQNMCHKRIETTIQFI